MVYLGYLATGDKSIFSTPTIKIAKREITEAEHLLLLPLYYYDSNQTRLVLEVRAENTLVEGESNNVGA